MNDQNSNWRCCPAKAFYLGVALGLIPFFSVVAVVVITLIGGYR